jgi:predicted nucleotidyltransferase
MGEERTRSSRGGGRSSGSRKDGWDKAEIIFKFLGGVLAALLVAALGIYGNSYLQKSQRMDSDIKLYTQLLSNKETAENSLRATMFGQILQSFLKPADAEETGEEADLARIREMRLNLELLARNFHESLDMKPLFQHLLMEILRPWIKLRRCSSALERCQGQITPEAELICGKAAERAGVDLNFMVQAGETQESQITRERRRIDRLARKYEQEIDLLVKAAKRVARKQREVLEEVAGKLRLEIPLKGQPPETICTAYSPSEWLPATAGTCETDDGKNVIVSGFSEEGSLVFKGTKTEGTATSSRYFRMRVRYACPDRKKVFVEVLSCPQKEGCEERPKDDPERDAASFWVDYFDFPLVDNTYLNSKERYSVFLEGFKEGPDGEEERADITLLYYPASYAGLKEKSFYNNQLMRGLLESDLFNKEN